MANIQSFDFQTAVKHLHDGKSVRCVDWKSDYYFFLESSILRDSFGSAVEFSCTCFLDDWELAQ